MKYILFDLETSDKEFVGQILSAYFSLVDERVSIELDSLDIKLRVSPLQLPQPEAIRVNKIDVLELQRTGLDELDGLVKIQKFISNIALSESGIKLVGYNSTKFDVPFLRTSLIRNGLNPYFKGMEYLDVIDVVKKLYVSNDRFRSLFSSHPVDGSFFSLRNVCRCVFQYDDEQSHDAREDVLLMHSLMKRLQINWNVDFADFKVYEPTKKSPVMVYRDVVDFETKSVVSLPYVLLDEDKKSSLWLDLSKDTKNRGNKSCIAWFNKATSPFFVSETQGEVLSAQEISDLLAPYREFNIHNFFPEKDCDIEQFIYSMSFNEIDALYEAIWMKDPTRLKRLQSRFGSILYLRYIMNAAPEEHSKMLQQYAIYRYGNKEGHPRLKLEKYKHDVNGEELPEKEEDYHLTFNQMCDNLHKIKKESKDPIDIKLMESLEKYYENSWIAGALRQL